jgi:hypothetical protein
MEVKRLKEFRLPLWYGNIQEDILTAEKWIEGVQV